MKIIFLDIDGVLNCTSTFQRYNKFLGIDPNLVKILDRIVKETNAYLVLSSTWRIDPKWRSTLYENGILHEFLDRTPYLAGVTRGRELNVWLAEKGKTIKEVQGLKYAILDDDVDFTPEQQEHLFKTSCQTGLTDEVANDLIKYLNEI